MDYDEFDDLVQKHTGKTNFECVTQFEWNNYSDYAHNNIEHEPNFARFKPDTPKQSVIDWYMADINLVNRWIAGEDKVFFGSYQILAWLCYNGHIKPGNYLIRC